MQISRILHIKYKLVNGLGIINEALTSNAKKISTNCTADCVFDFLWSNIKKCVSIVENIRRGKLEVVGKFYKEDLLVYKNK